MKRMKLPNGHIISYMTALESNPDVVIIEETEDGGVTKRRGTKKRGRKITEPIPEPEQQNQILIGDIDL